MNRHYAIGFVFALAILGDHALAGPSRTILATTRGGPVFFRGKTVQSEELNTAIKKARSGDTVLLMPGDYSQRLEISKKADPNNPIIISGMDGLTAFSCHDLPARDGKPVIKVSVSQGLVFRGIKFKNCWPTAYEIIDSDHIAITEHQFVGGGAPVVAKYRSTHNILIESNTWTLEKISEKITPNFFAEFSQVAGDIIVRDNRIEKVSGGVKFTGEEKPGIEPTKNVRIYRNIFDQVDGPALKLDILVDNIWFYKNQVNTVSSPFHLEEKSRSAVIYFDNDLKSTGTSLANADIPKIFQTKPLSENQYQASDNRYNSDVHVLKANLNGKEATIYLDQIETLAQIPSATTVTKDGAIFTSNKCKQKAAVITCTFASATVLPEKPDDTWLEVKDSTPISAWGMDAPLLRIVRN